MNTDEIRWTTWIFPSDMSFIVVDLIGDVTRFRMGFRLGNIYDIDSTTKLDDGLAIDQWIEFPLLPIGGIDNVIYHYTGINCRIKGDGTLNISMASLDEVDTLQAAQPSLVPLPGRSIFQGFNFTSERCAIRLGLTDANSWFILTKFILYYTEVWEDRAIG